MALAASLSCDRAVSVVGVKKLDMQSSEVGDGVILVSDDVKTEPEVFEKLRRGLTGNREMELVLHRFEEADGLFVVGVVIDAS